MDYSDLSEPQLALPSLRRAGRRRRCHPHGGVRRGQDPGDGYGCVAVTERKVRRLRRLAGPGWPTRRRCIDERRARSAPVSAAPQITHLQDRLMALGRAFSVRLTARHRGNRSDYCWCTRCLPELLKRHEKPNQDSLLCLAVTA